VFLRFFLIVLMALFALRAIGRFMGGLAQGARSDGARARQRPGEAPVKMAKDPVCGTFVVPGKALSATAGGATQWFCSEQCRAEFARRS
jgi:YHS domain-containing protein